jgi:puromycin-sensitive aminopeptidase
MSSYLFALVIGDVASTPEETVNNIPLKVWTLRGKEHMGAFGQEFTKKLLPWYEDYFAVPYHFGKYDQVAVPGFAAGAMENSGLVLFRQSALILDPQTASWQAEKNIAHVIAHEFAHMWFGNYVTMQWWDDLWLNEAFAEWISFKAVHAMAPNYQIWEDFQRGKIAALGTDALESTHPIYNKVETPDQALEMFDVITYQKGCSVMRMLENFLGHEAFRDGLRTYMQEFRESNAAGADLWRHLQNASSQPVTRIMESWVTQGGYPLITVMWDDATQALRLNQKRFLSDPRAKDSSQLWMVPLVIKFEDDGGLHIHRVLFDSRETSVKLPIQGKLHWLYANADEVGFYRQNLTGNLLMATLAHLDQLNPSEQMSLLADQYALVRNGTKKIGTFLEVLAAMSHSKHSEVLGEVVARMKTVEAFLEEFEDDVALTSFRAWVERLFKDHLATLGYEPQAGEERNVTQSRVYAIDAMAWLAQNKDAVAQSITWAQREAADPTTVDPNVAGVFVRVAARFGDSNRYNEFISIYNSRRQAGAAPQVRDRYVYSLPHFRSPELVARTFQHMAEKTIPQEMVVPLLNGMLGLRHSQMTAWDFLQERFSELREQGFWTTLIEACGQLPATLREDYIKFCTANLKGEAQQGYGRALETMDQIDEFKKRIRADLVAWFKA